MAESIHSGLGWGKRPAKFLGDVDAVYVKIAQRILPFLISLFIWA
jgi:hypothetical protein